jgi:hypothetical protein
MGNKGLDVGTNMLVAAMLDEDDNTIFKMQRDAFYKIVPKSEVHRNSIMSSLEKRGANFITDASGSFIVVGEDALNIAIERKDVAQRPLNKGVISPIEKDSLPMIKLIIKELIGEGSKGDKLFYSVPGIPVDASFDIVYHREMLGRYLTGMGYESQPINEAFSIALSELLDDGLTGVSMSFGAGMTNIVVIHEGDPLVEFSICRGGDFIDTSVGKALDISPSLVQQEKEAGTDLTNPSNSIMEAVSVYYSTLIRYALDNIVYELEKRKKDLPNFRSNVPIVVSGGLTLANGFEDKFGECLSTINFPIPVSEIKRAEGPMTAVANGCLLASQI